ncbi:MAG TPA: glycerol-3-phosphate 1-O-acyltransferase [Firmicutes bacterium]|nr:glycerol-3-phosphate 1-O-acyltransferase [Bacillota bacterium]
MAEILITAAAAYIAGSIPTGYWLIKALKGIDIRTIGSGNIGATNVKRAAGTKWFFVVLFFDALKGFVPVFAAAAFWGGAYPYIGVVAGACAILGHTFTLFLGFKGGKGVATGLGVFLALAPLSVITSLLVFGSLLLIFKYISLGSIAAAVMLPFFVFVYGEGGHSDIVLIFSAAVAVFVAVKHKDNIVRLAKGTENKIGSRKGDKK